MYPSVRRQHYERNSVPSDAQLRRAQECRGQTECWRQFTHHVQRSRRRTMPSGLACRNTPSRRGAISPRAAERSWSNICSSAAHRSSSDTHWPARRYINELREKIGQIEANTHPIPALSGKDGLTFTLDKSIGAGQQRNVTRSGMAPRIRRARCIREVGEWRVRDCLSRGEGRTKPLRRA